MGRSTASPAPHPELPFPDVRVRAVKFGIRSAAEGTTFARMHVSPSLDQRAASIRLGSSAATTPFQLIM